MFDGLIKELKKLEHTSYSMKILADEEGYVDKECPDSKCLKKSKFAYHILKVEKLDNPISLKELKDKFGFTAPQSYAYDLRYPELVNYINTLSKKVVIDNEV